MRAAYLYTPLILVRLFYLLSECCWVGDDPGAQLNEGQNIPHTVAS